MANATKIPTLKFFQWATPASPNPRLASPISATDTTIVFTTAPLDGAGAAITGNFLMGIRTAGGYVETIYVPPAAIAGLTATGCTRGIKLEGLDYTTAGAGLAVAHLQDESVFCNVTGVFESIMTAWAQGSLASGGSGLIIGTDASGTTTVSRSTGVGTSVPWLRWLAGGTKAQFSDDGAIFNNFSDVSASVLVKTSAADTTPGYLNNKVTVSGTGVVVTKSIVNPGANEVLNIDVNSTAVDAVVDAPYTAAEDIAIGLPVSKTTVDGTVELTMASILSAAGTESEFGLGVSATNVQTCYVAENKIAVAFQSNSALPKLRVGTVALDKTITWGALVNIAGANGMPIALRYMTDNKIAILANTNAGQAYLAIANIVGTVPTLGASVNFGAATSMSSHDGNMAIIATDKVLITYRDNADGNKGKAICTTVAGAVVGAFGAAVEMLTLGEVGNATASHAVAKSGTDKAVAFFRNTTTNKGKAVYIEAAGTVLSVNAQVEFSANNIKSDYPMSADYITDGRIIFTWADATDNFAYARVANIAAFGVVTFPTAALVLNAVATTVNPMVYVNSATEAYIAYNEAGATDGKFNKITIAGTVLTKGIQYSFNGGVNALSFVSIAKVSSRNKFIIAYEDGVDSLGKAEVFQEYDNTASLVGFAVATTLSGVALTVRSKGLIGSQVGLVAGTTYYIGSTGAISVTDSKQIKVGVAKDATTLDIAIYGSNVISKANADTLTNGSNADALHTHLSAYASGITILNSPAAGGQDITTDTVITCGFQPAVIELSYKNRAYHNGAMGYSEGITTYLGTVKKGSVVFIDSDSTGFTAGTFTTGPNYAPGVNPDFAKDGSATVSAVTVSIINITATGFTVRYRFQTAVNYIQGSLPQVFSAKAWK